MAIFDYSEPVARLLTEGECSSDTSQPWLDYQSLGIRDRDIPDLIQMATDQALYDLDANALETWAPIHAWRALGQLGATGAVNPLLQQANEYVDEEGWWDWMAMELPTVFAMIGESILPNLVTVIHDRTRSSWARVIALDGLTALAQRSEESNGSVRQQCIAALLEELAYFVENPPEFNSFVIGALSKLRVVTAAPLIEQAFAAGAVDEMMHGDWNEIQVQLGLKSRIGVPRRVIDSSFLEFLESLERPPSAGFGDVKVQSSKSNRKATQKQQSVSRRKNRKKK